MAVQQQERHTPTPAQLWQELIRRRWTWIQRNIADLESSLRTADPLNRKAIEQQLKGLKIAAMGVWFDGKREGIELPIPGADRPAVTDRKPGG